jgi:hypothetical protein
LSDGFDIYSEDISVEQEEDGSVSSLEGFSSGCSDDTPVTPAKQLKASVNLPGSNCEKSPNPLKKEPLTAKVYVQPKAGHVTCYVQTPPSKPRRKSSDESKIPPSPASR